MKYRFLSILLFLAIFIILPGNQAFPLTGFKAEVVGVVYEKGKTTKEIDELVEELYKIADDNPNNFERIIIGKNSQGEKQIQVRIKREVLYELPELREKLRSDESSSFHDDVDFVIYIDSGEYYIAW